MGEKIIGTPWPLNYSKAEMNTAIDKLIHPDSTPTKNSQNLITSGGVHSSLQKKVNPNLLDNWYFVGGGSQQGGEQFPINQRGQTSYSGAVYGIDRWHNEVEGTCTLDNGGLSVVPDSNAGYFQALERIDRADLVGKTLTASILFSNGNSFTTCTGVLSNSYVQSPTIGGGYIRFKWIDLWQCIVVEFVFVNNASVQAVKLELGDTQTLAHQENGVWVLNEIPNYQEQLFRCQTSRADTADTYSNKINIDNYYIRPNLLDNWYFVGGGSQQGGGQFPINQRGQTSYNIGNNTYGVDRWVSATNWGNIPITVNIISSGLDIDGDVLPVYPGSYGCFFQRIENSEKLIGKTVTLSVLVDSVIADNEGVFPSISFIDEYNAPVQQASITASGVTKLTYQWASNISGVGIVMPSGETSSSKIAVQAIKLELGDTQTLAHQENGVWVLNEIPNYQQELVKCQRFFYKFPEIGSSFIEPVGVVNSQYRTIFSLPVPMRIVPTISDMAGYSTYSPPAYQVTEGSQHIVFADTVFFALSKFSANAEL